MKNLVTTLLLAVIMSASAYAQSPNNMTYQAAVRDTANAVIANQSVGVKIEIFEGSTLEYAETHVVTTNANGLFTLIIGNGTVTTGNWSNLDWSTGSPFSVSSSVDPTGGTNYTLSTTNDLYSVPFAFHAQTASTALNYNETDPLYSASPASNISNSDISNWNGKQNQLVAGNNITINGNTISATTSSSTPDFYLGQDTLGGIVFYVYTDGTGTQHGLIVSTTESSSSAWQTTSAVTNGTRSYDGSYNTGQMTNSPAKTWCTNLGTGWYLPSVDELNLLYQNRYHVNSAIAGTSGTLLDTDARYWSSTERTWAEAFAVYFRSGDGSSEFKSSTYKVRAVREF